MDSPPHHFATSVLAEIRKRAPEAAPLQVESARPRIKVVPITIVDEGEEVRLFGLGAPSASVNVMSLFVWQNERWVPTFERGTPAMLAELLTGPLRHLWAIPVAMMGSPDQWSGTSAQHD